MDARWRVIVTAGHATAAAAQAVPCGLATWLWWNLGACRDRVWRMADGTYARTVHLPTWLVGPAPPGWDVAGWDGGGSLPGAAPPPAPPGRFWPISTRGPYGPEFNKWRGMC